MLKILIAILFIYQIIKQVKKGKLLLALSNFIVLFTYSFVAIFTSQYNFMIDIFVNMFGAKTYYAFRNAMAPEINKAVYILAYHIYFFAICQSLLVLVKSIFKRTNIIIKVKKYILYNLNIKQIIREKIKTLKINKLNNYMFFCRLLR